MRLFLSAFLLLTTLPLIPALAATADTPENRRIAAEAYFKVEKPAELAGKMTQAVAAQMPEPQRTDFMNFMHDHDPVASMMPQLQDVVVKTFSVSEIEALTRFYGSPEGRAIKAKLPTYMANIMPIIQANVMAMMQSYIQTKKAQAAQQQAQPPAAH